MTETRDDKKTRTTRGLSDACYTLAALEYGLDAESLMGGRIRLKAVQGGDGKRTAVYDPVPEDLMLLFDACKEAKL